MYKFSIRLLTLAMFAMTSAAVYMIAPAKAATENGTTVKKKHKKARVNSESGQMRAPATSSQSPPNMSDDPNRKVSY
jgi:hypothetical protein